MRFNLSATALAAIWGLVLLSADLRGDPPAPAHKDADDIALYTPDKIKWQAAPPSLPKGAMMAVLEGDPSKEGPFVFRVKAPDGYRVPPHTHPKIERVTVISGTLNIGMGDRFDEKATRAMAAGTYGQW